MITIYYIYRKIFWFIIANLVSFRVFGQQLENSNVNPFTFTGEFFWKKLIEESICFAIKIPNPAYQDGNQVFTGQLINPKWKYVCGKSFAITFPLMPTLFQGWSMTCETSYIQHNPDPVSISSTEYDLYAIAVQPMNHSLIAFVNNLSGKLTAKHYALNLIIGRYFACMENFGFFPVVGIRAFFLNQETNIHYSDYYKVELFKGWPQNVFSSNKILSFGPQLGVHFVFDFPNLYSLNCACSGSVLTKQQNTGMTYSNMLNKDSQQETRLLTKSNRISTLSNIKIGINKRWIQTKLTSISLMIGWEQTIWFNYINANYFNSLGSFPKASHLSEQGFVFRCQIVV